MEAAIRSINSRLPQLNARIEFYGGSLTGELGVVTDIYPGADGIDRRKLVITPYGRKWYGQMLLETLTEPDEWRLVDVKNYAVDDLAVPDYVIWTAIDELLTMGEGVADEHVVDGAIDPTWHDRYEHIANHSDAFVLAVRRN